MKFKFNEETPIYLQIIENIKTKIISKQYHVGEKLPSVRDFALEFEVNPNTIQKSLAELEQIGLILTDRTNGKYVTQNEELINRLKSEMISSNIQKFVFLMQEMGISKKELIEIIIKEG